MTHFLNTPAARSLSIAQVLRLSDEEAVDIFKRVRFASNYGEPFCPSCGGLKVYTLAEQPVRWKCAGCRRKFSVTNGTIFHSRKLSIRDHLAVIALFCNGVKGVSALQMSRNMNVSPKSIFVMLHKLREAMGATLDDGSELAGETWFLTVRCAEHGFRIFGRRRMIRQLALRQSLVTTNHTGRAGRARGHGRPCTDRVGAAERSSPHPQALSLVRHATGPRAISRTEQHPSCFGAAVNRANLAHRYRVQAKEQRDAT